MTKALPSGITKIVIPESVTSIEDGALSKFSNLQELQSFLSHDKKLMSLNRICDDVKDEFVNEHEAPGYVHESIPFEESLDDKYDVNVHADNHNSSFKFSDSDVIDADVIEVNDNTQ